MPSSAQPPLPPCDRVDLMVRCLEALERDGAAGVAAVLAAHPAAAGELMHRLMLLGDLGLLPEPERLQPGDS
jgi:hypothetical protein